MNAIQTAIIKAMKKSVKSGQTLYVFATYYKICISLTPPPFGAAHWMIDGNTSTRVESTL